MFPVDQFKWHAAKSIIAHSLGDKRSAQAEASEALKAASQLKSGFARHPKLGLVGPRYEAVRLRMESLSET